MFRTEHLEGRLLYETDKVVCINIHLNSNYASNNNYVTQVLLSLVNKKTIYYCSSVKMEFGIILPPEEFSKEIDEGISKYLSFRQKLELD